MNITTPQIAAIHTLFAKTGLKDQKESIVSSFTGGRSASVGDMQRNEAAALIGHLKALNPQDQKATKMRNKIIGMAHEMRWHTSPQPSPYEGEGVYKPRIDMARLNNWCVSRSYLHKKLDAYTYKELPKLVTQFEQVYKSYLNGL